MAVPVAQPADVTWTGAAGDGRWNNPANWDLGRLPSGSDRAIFGDPSSNGVVIDGGGATAGSVVFTDQGFLIYGAAPLLVTGSSGLDVDQFTSFAAPLHFESSGLINVIVDRGLIVSGKIVAPDGINKIGGGYLHLSNDLGSSVPFLTITEGSVDLGYSGVTGAVARIARRVNIGEHGTLNLSGGSTSIGSLAGKGLVNLGSQTLTTNGDNTDSTFSGVLSGTFGRVVKEGTGRLTLEASQSYNRGTLVNAGTLALTKNARLASPIEIGSGGTLLLDFDQDVLFDNRLRGFGTFVKEGSGTVEIDNGWDFQGNVHVREGVLRPLYDTLWDTTYVSVDGGTLAGQGDMPEVRVLNGGVLSPDILEWVLAEDSTYTRQLENIAEFTVQDIIFNPGSIYEVDITADGASDRIKAERVEITGGSVRVSPRAGDYTEGMTYTIVEAQSLVGTFENATASDLAFLTPTLSSDGQRVTLALERKIVSAPSTFETAAQTQNQANAARAVESTGPGGVLYRNVLVQTVDGARQAFDAVSGEGHASLPTVLAQTSLTTTDNALDRATSGSNARTNGGEVMSFVDTGATNGASRSGDGQVWFLGYGSRGLVETNGNAASVRILDGGMQLGADDWFGDFRLGAMLMVGRTSADVDDRSTSIDSNSYGLGLYGGTNIGATNLALGGSYTRHDVHSSRNVIFPGFSETVTGSYAAGTSQVFGELNHTFELGTVDIQPFARAAYVHVDTQGFSETGGSAALTVSPTSINALFTTLGIRAETEFRLEDDLSVSVKGGLGWRHAFGDEPTSTMALTGGTSFSATGASLVRDSLVLETGVGIKMDGGASLDVSYNGSLSAGSYDHSVRAKLAVSF